MLDGLVIALRRRRRRRLSRPTRTASRCVAPPSRAADAARELPERSRSATGRSAARRSSAARSCSRTPSAGSARGALIAAPMLGGGRLLGVIALAARVSRPIGRSELLLLQAFANRVGEILLAGAATSGRGSSGRWSASAPPGRRRPGSSEPLALRSGVGVRERAHRGVSSRGPSARRLDRAELEHPAHRRPAGHHQPDRLTPRRQPPAEVEEQVDARSCRGS